MTPQVPRHRAFPSTSRRDSAVFATARRNPHVRYSAGGFVPGGIRGLYSGQPVPAPVFVESGKAEGSPRGPRRVRLVEPWRVDDLVVPITGDDDDEDVMKEEEDIKDEEMDIDESTEEHMEVVAESESKAETLDEKAKEERDREMMPPPTTPGRVRNKLSEEERQVRPFSRVLGIVLQAGVY